MSCETLLPTHIDPKINRLDETGCERLTLVEWALGQLPTLHNPGTIDARYLHAMADEYEAGAFYDFEEDLRSLIQYAQQHYPRLGTVAAVKEVFAALNIEASVIEWYESGKDPYLFDIDLSLTDREITPQLVASLRRLVMFTKNARSHIDELTLSYLNRHRVDIHTGGVGEARYTAPMIDGYAATQSRTVSTHTGAVGELCAVAPAIDGYRTIQSTTPLFHTGAVGEVIYLSKGVYHE